MRLQELIDAEVAKESARKNDIISSASTIFKTRFGEDVLEALMSEQGVWEYSTEHIVHLRFQYNSMSMFICMRSEGRSGWVAYFMNNGTTVMNNRVALLMAIANYKNNTLESADDEENHE